MATVLELIGNTPLVELKRVRPLGNARVFIKLEFVNPTGSHKDRIALYMIKDAIQRYGLKPGDVVVEASSGNTAISVAFVAQQLSLKPIIVVPRGTSKSKIAMLRLLEAEVVEGGDKPSDEDYYIRLAERIARDMQTLQTHKHTTRQQQLRSGEP
jgi:cysteine synthase A